MPFRVPVRKNEDGGAARRFDRRLPTAGGRPEVGVNGIVLGPRRFDRAGEAEDVFGVEAIVRGGGGGIPVAAVFDGALSIGADKGTRIGLIAGIANVLESPVEGLNAAVIVGGPAAEVAAGGFSGQEDHSR